MAETVRVVQRGRESSCIWSTSPGLADIPADLEEQVRQRVDAMNRAAGWIRYDVWSF